MNEGNANLCQTDESSCIACCIGVYINMPQSDITNVFDRRAEIVRDSEGPLDYHKKVTGEENDVPFCKFLGYLDEEKSSVGCMIHSEHVNIEEDLRQHDKIRRSVCSGYSCKTNKSFKCSDEMTKQDILDSISGMNWYAFSHFIRQGNL